MISGETDNSVWVFNEKDSSITKEGCRWINNRGDAIVLSGINKNEVVVSAGASSLKEGQKVRPIKETSETNIETYYDGFREVGDKK